MPAARILLTTSLLLTSLNTSLSFPSHYKYDQHLADGIVRGAGDVTPAGHYHYVVPKSEGARDTGTTKIKVTWYAYHPKDPFQTKEVYIIQDFEAPTTYRVHKFDGDVVWVPTGSVASPTSAKEGRFVYKGTLSGQRNSVNEAYVVWKGNPILGTNGSLHQVNTQTNRLEGVLTLRGDYFLKKWDKPPSK